MKKKLILHLAEALIQVRLKIKSNQEALDKPTVYSSEEQHQTSRAWLLVTNDTLKQHEESLDQALTLLIPD